MIPADRGWTLMFPHSDRLHRPWASVCVHLRIISETTKNVRTSNVQETQTRYPAPWPCTGMTRINCSKRFIQRWMKQLVSLFAGQQNQSGLKPNFYFFRIDRSFNTKLHPSIIMKRFTGLRLMCIYVHIRDAAGLYSWICPICPWPSVQRKRNPELFLSELWTAGWITGDAWAVPELGGSLI